MSMLGNAHARNEGRLKVIASELAAIAGWLSFSLGNRGDAHASYMLAADLAKDVSSASLNAYVLGQRSHLYSSLWRDGQPGSADLAVAMLDQAIEVTPESAGWRRV
jgi:hypothetical protein